MQEGTASELQGLTDREVAERIARGDVNRVPTGPSRTTREIVLANVVTRFNILLGILLLIVLVVVRDPRDALFGIVMVTNAAIGIVQELRAKATLDRLAVLTTPRVTTIRNGIPTEIAIEEVVVDDVVSVKAGDQLVVDGTVLAERGLEIDESLLTGESDPVLKAPGHRCLSGSFAVAGSGLYRATRVGAKAYAAALAAEAKRFTLVKSELRDGIDWILGAISWVIGPVIVLLVWSQFKATDAFVAAVNSAVAGAVGMIPQGLVLLTSIAFAVGVIRLGRRNVLVQELPAIEGLARVDTICFDKTGTLTEGVLVVHSIDQLEEVDPAAPLGALGAIEPEPNATLHAIRAAFPEPRSWRAEASVPFSSARKWSGGSFGEHGSWLLGAPEILAPGSASILERADHHAASGRRVLLLAASHARLHSDALPHEIRPVALVILGDRVRTEAGKTLRYFAEQGVHAKVISGDHPRTVSAIAREVGVPGAARVFDARRLPEDFDELCRVVEEHTVFGRVTPYQKREMVAALQAMGHTVAMTGDGVNDVLALKDADIGIAIGSGAAASRAVAQLVLIDGDFDNLPGVVGEGRRVISNIERVANLFVTKTIYAILLALATGLAGRAFPFLPRHLTLVASVTIGIPAFFLALAPSTKRARPGFIARVLRFSIPTGVAAGLATFGAYELAIAENATLSQARTTATFVLAAIGLFALGMVGRPLEIWKRWLIGSMAGVLILLVLTTPSQDFFGLRLPTLTIMLASVGIISITGFAMVGSLFAVGWIRQVPDLIKAAPPPSETAAWSAIRTWWDDLTARFSREELRRQARFWRIDEEDLEHGPAPPPAGESAWFDPDADGEQTVPSPPTEIDWFDPDTDFPDLRGDEEDPLAVPSERDDRA